MNREELYKKYRATLLANRSDVDALMLIANDAHKDNMLADAQKIAILAIANALMDVCILEAIKNERVS